MYSPQHFFPPHGAFPAYPNPYVATTPPRFGSPSSVYESPTSTGYYGSDLTVRAAGTTPWVTQSYIRNGMDVNAVDTADCGFTPLHFAARDGNFLSAERLLEAGADPERKDWRGMTAAHVAQEYGHFELAQTIAGAAGPKLTTIEGGVSAANTMIEAARARASKIVAEQAATKSAEEEEATQVQPAEEEPISLDSKDYDVTPATPTGLPAKLLPKTDGSLTDFMRSLKLEMYLPNLQSQAIYTLKDLKECHMTSAELKAEIGMTKLLHRKRLMAALGDAPTAEEIEKQEAMTAAEEAKMQPTQAAAPAVAQKGEHVQLSVSTPTEGLDEAGFCSAVAAAVGGTVEFVGTKTSMLSKTTVWVSVNVAGSDMGKLVALYGTVVGGCKVMAVKTATMAANTEAAETAALIAKSQKGGPGAAQAPVAADAPNRT